MTLKLFYAAGPGNVIAAHKHWRAGVDDPTQTSLTYSGQFADFVHETHAFAYIVSSNQDQDILKDENFVLENRPKPFLKSAAHFHLSEVIYGLSLLITAVRVKADVAFISSDTTHYFVLALFRLCGIQVVSVLHNTLWPIGHPPTRLNRRALMFLNGLYFRFFASGVIGISPECVRQVARVSGGRARNLQVMYPQFRKQPFETNEVPISTTPPFRIFFAGRVERNKGVFDILDMARQLEDTQPSLVQWEICGDGTDLQELKSACAHMGLQSVVEIRGWTSPAELRSLQANSHLTIVPTRNDFAEGMAKTAIESVLVGRPVLVSSVTPALEVLGSAAISAPANDVAKFVLVILELTSDHSRYRRLVRACKDVQERFYDRHNGFCEKLRASLRELGLD